MAAFSSNDTSLSYNDLDEEGYTYGIHIRNINSKVSKEQLIAMFQQYGPLTDVQIIPGTTEEQSSPSALIYFLCRTDAEKAVREINETELFEKEWEVSWAQRVLVPDDPIFLQHTVEGVYTKYVNMYQKSLREVEVLNCKLLCIRMQEESLREQHMMQSSVLKQLGAVMGDIHSFATKLLKTNLDSNLKEKAQKLRETSVLKLETPGQLPSNLNVKEGSEAEVLLSKLTLDTDTDSA